MKRALVLCGGGSLGSDEVGVWKYLRERKITFDIVTGTSIGTLAAIVPLSIAAIPFVARVVETALKEVDAGIIEAGLAMGASPVQIIRKILLPESWPGIVAGLTLAIISLIGLDESVGQELSKSAAVIARSEGLEAHARSADQRIMP